ncbi:MAG: ornithine carbamoyltransferase [Elusimicrobia bacterium RIFCSPLOWO2_02_FULL_39_32]|nr:MAG: ornithine carbamoyltransferase [Elusimicrobia bacterium GWA2_38_7]OGR78394.1 MAG: ornithine carbamoyltransferase [Elusimicrobia bacterium RIFCSPHIGHO2_02_FULL_39_36]OGR92153.1 MAG: ornithine carbamoyltransferase [Elusimicrobia bacterium RIFCSPLOWO2_02_FULL_39_32]OGR99979.1 MAG: ornithine carbamoyltransferase [Elusimicrobia bacterium RIFCSPLOWO2_12_FULL_39_28]
MNKNFISLADFSKEEIFNILLEAKKLKNDKKNLDTAKLLQGKTLALILQKPSTRTLVSFAAGMVQLGGNPLILNPQDLQLKRGETLTDTAKILSFYVDAIMIRANKHEEVEELAKYAAIPVINGLTDKEHPCQVLSDIFTILEQKKINSPEDLKQIKISYVGDGNNISHSLILAAAILGMEIVVSSPKNYVVEKEFVQKGLELGRESGAKISLITDPMAAVGNSDIIYTDVWASMGKEEEREHRKQIFKPYQVNVALLAFAKPQVLVMHCLPAHRGEEITDEVMDGPRSIIFEQAENRLHVQKAILLHLLKSL